MDPQRWTRVESLYHAALKKRPAERARYLAEECGDEPQLKREIESLLACADMELNSPIARGQRWPSGFRLGSYEIIEALGAGGMGEVYRARDLKLKREVAIKILPEEFTLNSDRVSRFQREAEVLASLNHPNIANIYHLEEQNASRYLVLELVEGETLAERISRGPIPVDEALPVAQRIAEALEAAHEKGIIHRDLKPANVKITTDGMVKVLDFGLAKAIEGSPSSPTLSNSPTILSGTMPGMILGTAAYMSPEQARGRQADQRTDIFSFGCVLYEMLTGSQAFQGESVSDVLASVMKVEPDFDRLPKNLNPRLSELVRRSLVKSPRNRWQAIGDIRVELERLIADPVGVVSPSGAPVQVARWLWFATAAALALLVAAVLAGLYFMRTPAELPVMRFAIPAPGFSGELKISPDGQRIAYVAANGRQRTIWIRPIDSLAAQQLPDTEDASGLFWAPDSHRLAFFANGKLKKADLSGNVQTIGDAPAIVVQGTWTRDGMILFGGMVGKPGIYRIPEFGGDPVLATAADPSSNPVQLFPWSLPDGRHLLFHTINTDHQTGSVYFGSMDSKSPTRLMEIPNLTAGGFNSPAVYAQGYLLFSRDRKLLAQPFDAVHGTLSGEAALVAENVTRDFSVSETGALVYHAPSQTGAGRLSWLDREGKPVAEAPTPDSAGSLSLSPDGRIAMDNFIRRGSTDIWVIDARGVSTKLTTGNPTLSMFPVWSPDDNSSRIVFSSSLQNEANPKLYQISSNAPGAAQQLWPGNIGTLDFPEDWVKAGIVFGRLNLSDTRSVEMWVLPMSDKKPKPFPYLQNGSMNIHAQVSPDGRYIAYVTNLTGKSQVVVQTFPDPQAGRWPIDEGAEPVWKRDGRELYYVASDGTIMAVPVKLDPTFQAGQPSKLFKISPTPEPLPFGHHYAVSADGRFLVGSAPNASASIGESASITVVLNWTTALRKK